MSDAVPPALAGEGQGAMTEAQVMEGIEGLLDDKPKRRQPPRQLETRPLPGAEAPAVEGQGSQDPLPGPEDPPTREEEEEDDAYEPDTEPVEEGEESAHQGIEPPSSWTKQDREVFSALPPEAQAIIARRDSEQNAAFKQKTTEIAEHRKALESTFQTVQQERQTYAQNLRQLLAVAMPEAERFSQIDWTRLAQEQPADYVRMTAERDALRGRLGTIAGELQQVEVQSQQAQAYQFAQIRQAEQQRLVEAIPEYGDPEKGPAKIASVRNWLSKKGFSDQEIGAVVDHRVLLVVEEAMQSDRHKEIRQQAQQKRTNGAAPQPPGASRAGPDNRAAKRRQDKMNALKQSGSEKDAIGYLMEIL
jgi:hypothetical protein